ncbi:MAG: hypothetical protein IKG71_08685 [Firmicutes bacterium]|nr:hypothetical protein [Bacillota bacterium]
MSLLKNFGKVITACKKEYRKKRYGEFELLEGYSEGSVLCFGDNEDFMKFLLQKQDMKGKIQQIYIDPPFFSKATYDATVKVQNAEGDEIKIKKRAYEDIWEEGMEEYLKMMGVRLMLMKDLLAETGTIWVHLDWHGVYYVKVLMDEIFGERTSSTRSSGHISQEDPPSHTSPESTIPYWYMERAKNTISISLRKSRITATISLTDSRALKSSRTRSAGTPW